jgi:hypothetical protein
LHARTVWTGTWETRLPGLVSEDRSYKPMVKSGGGQRESEGVVVLVIGVKLKASEIRAHPAAARASR